MSREPILIKRYENRRLYDTHTSRYVNLEDMARMVRQGLDFRVIDAKSGDDQTRRVLTQIILEEAKKEEGGPPIDFLRQMINASDRSVRDFLRWYLGQAMDVYRRFQGVMQGGPFQDFQGQLDALAKKWPASKWNPASGFTAAWPFGSQHPNEAEAPETGTEPPPGPMIEAVPLEEGLDDGEADDPEEPDSSEDLAAEMAREMAELRRRMEEMEEKLSGPASDDD
jgi:polyhydroxyalkanoate synthesis repressor PhaR